MADQEKGEEEKDTELDLIAEQELLRLTRQFRVLEGDKEAYLEEATKALRRQRKAIFDLENQKLQLVRTLTVSRSKDNVRKDARNSQRISNLISEQVELLKVQPRFPAKLIFAVKIPFEIFFQEDLIGTIKKEKSDFKDLDFEIQRLERQIAQQRKVANQKSSSSANSSKNSSSSTTLRDKKELGQRIVLLENRLDGVMTSFNATLAQNTEVRKEIDHLVQERSNFNDMIAKLQKKSAANKRTIADITEMAILAFDQRDESQSKITALQERNEKDAATYAAELKELQRTLDHDEKLKDFLFHKSNDRSFAADFAAEQDREKDRKEAQAKDMEHTKKYKDAFERIKSVAPSESNLDKIVADFIKVEDQNFALFNYVTEMNNQVEGLQENIVKLRTDIKEAKGRGDERERQQREQLQTMERKVSSSVAEADATEAKVELMEGVLAKLKNGTEEVYLMSQCGATPVLSLLGGKLGTDRHDERPPERPFVTENNVIMYLDMIHEKIIELKCVAQFVEQQRGRDGASAPSSVITAAPQKDKDSSLSLSTSKKPSTLKRFPSSAALLGQEDGSESEEASASDNVRPFEMAALKARAFRITKKERIDEFKELTSGDVDSSGQPRRASKSIKGQKN